MLFNSQRLCTTFIDNYNLSSCELTIRAHEFIITEPTNPNHKKISWLPFLLIYKIHI